MRVSAEVKVILSIHPEQRTEQQLAKVCKAYTNASLLYYKVK